MVVVKVSSGDVCGPHHSSHGEPGQLFVLSNSRVRGVQLARCASRAFVLPSSSSSSSSSSSAVFAKKKMAALSTSGPRIKGSVDDGGAMVWIGGIPSALATDPAEGEAKLRDLLAPFGTVGHVTLRSKAGDNKSWALATFKGETTPPYISVVAAVLRRPMFCETWLTTRHLQWLRRQRPR
eukprot:COSAG01_NODE_6629_length_3570_cov_14.389513_2_plen_180_part_00